MFTLGIETSCDDTAVALVDNKGFVLDSRRWTKDADHLPFGGIIPERASRNHLDLLTPMIDKILLDHEINPHDLKGIAVTNRPGLLGSLIVGLVTAKALSLTWKIPYVGVNHLEGHFISSWLSKNKEQTLDISFPQISLIVSGGHTHLVYAESFGSYKVLGKTKDDAAGEAIDKFSNLVGLGFPGGPKVDKASQKGDAARFKFPRPMIKEDDFDFSFSGLKAAGLRKVEDLKKENLNESLISDLCASYLEAVTDVLVARTKKALEVYKPKVLSVVGGVSANTSLRKKMKTLSEEMKIPLMLSEIEFCTDNAAMIAYAGAKRLEMGERGELGDKPSARSLVRDFV